MDKLLELLLNIPAESQNIEFKRLKEGEKIVKKVIETIVAMANTEGGSIILGKMILKKQIKKA